MHNRGALYVLGVNAIWKNSRAPCGPKGPAAGAKRLHAAEGREGERSKSVVPEAVD